MSERLRKLLEQVVREEEERDLATSLLMGLLVRLEANNPNDKELGSEVRALVSRLKRII